MWSNYAAPKGCKRHGIVWEDGFESDTSRLPYQRSPIITYNELNESNLPPFFIRLTDNQVGHIYTARQVNNFQVPASSLARYWPHDFDINGCLRSARQSVGGGFFCTAPPSEGWTSTDMETTKMLKGGPLPEDPVPRIPGRYVRTFLSSGHRMFTDPDYARVAALLTGGAESATPALAPPDKTNSLKRKVDQLEQDLSAKDSTLVFKDEVIHETNQKLAEHRADAKKARTSYETTLKKKEQVLLSWKVEAKRVLREKHDLEVELQALRPGRE